MRKVTLSIPEHVYEWARIRAVERGTSVSSMIAEYLSSAANRDKQFARLEELQNRIVAEIEHFSAAERLDRANVRDRTIR